MKLLDTIFNFFAPEIPVMDPALLEREAAAEREMADGFRVLQETRKEYDKRATGAGRTRAGLETLKSELAEADRLVIEAFRGTTDDG